MTFEQAIQNEIDGTGDHEENIQAILAAVEPLCQTATGDNTTRQTTLYEWLAAGDYSIGDTPQSLANEWDRTQ